jgi:hypothetical protein
VIRDVIEFRRSGLARRQTADLNISVEAWRAAIRHAGRRADTPVHTFLVPPQPATAVDREDQVVYAVRTDPPPDATGMEHRLLWWRPVDELEMPVGTLRAAMRRFAGGEGVPLHTFLAPQGSVESGDRPGLFLYAVWAYAGPDPFDIVAPPPRPAPCPVTDLAAYLARRSDPSAPDSNGQSRTVQQMPPQL